MSNGRPWTQADTDTLERMAGKYTDEEIAGVTGHKERTVKAHRQDLGLAACRRVDWTKRPIERYRAAA